MEIKGLIDQIPEEVLGVAKTLKDGGFEAYLVGGCVRDLFLKRKAKDWDITTNAVPEQILGLFPHTFYENTYGTVGVVTHENAEESVRLVEVTPYRLESEYSDKRRPNSVIFSQKIENDLKRRDFTINSIALEPFKGQIIDIFQ